MRRPRYALAALVVSAFAVYALAGTTIASPHAFADELLYLEAASSIAEGKGLTLRGEPYEYGPLYPLALAPLVRLAPDPDGAWVAARALNALFLALTAVPVFVLARRLLRPWPAVAVSGLAVAIPSAKYVSLVMTESLAYLAAAWAMVAIVLAAERPTWVRQTAALGAVAVAVGVRTQFVAFAVAYVLALTVATILVPGRSARPASLGRAYLPTALALAAGAVFFVVVPVVRGVPPAILGKYDTLWRSYDPVEVLRWIVFHLANLELYVAVIPFAVAPIVLASLYRRARAGDEREAAFLALFVAVNTVLLLVVAAFNSTIWAGERLHDRQLFYVVPLWLVVLFVWLRDGLPRPLVATSVGAAAALILPLLLPLPDFVWDEYGLQHNAAVTALWVQVSQGLESIGLGVLVALAVVPLLAVLLLSLIPPRLGPVAPGLVLAFFLAAGVAAWTNVAGVARDAAAVLPAPSRAWVDERVPDGRAATLLTAIGTCYPTDATQARYLVEFFNRRVVDVAHLGDRPDYLQPDRARVAPDGAVHADGVPLHAEYVVAPAHLAVEGTRIATGTSVRLALTRVDGPVRVAPERVRAELARGCG